MNARVQFEDEADLEYRLSGRWYETQRQNLGIEFFDAVDAAIGRILDFPRLGSPVPIVRADLPVRRIAVSRFPFHVVYLDTGEQIRILAVAHDRRKPGYWTSRVK